MGDLRMSGLLDHRGNPLPSAEVSRWDSSWQGYLDAYQSLALQPAFTLDGNKVEQVSDAFVAYVHHAYKSNGVVFAVSEARKLLLSEMTFKFRRRGQVGGGNDLFGNQDLAVLEEPWPGGTTQTLISRMEQDVTNAGNAFVAMSEDGQRLFRRRPDWCEFILTESPLYAVEADILGIKYTAGGVNSGGPSKLYLIEDVAHWAPIPDPIAEYRGMSWLTPVIREMQADGAATAHKLAFFENAATPNLSVSLKDTVTVDQFRDFMRAMDETHGGVKNAYKTLYLGGGADVSVVGADMRQLDFKATQGAGETRIAAAGRVPPIIVGLSEGLSAATYSNYAQARRAFGDSWARPTWRSLCGALATLVKVPANAELWYDDRDIAFLREDRKDFADIQSTQMATINAAVAAGWTPDSAQTAVLAEDFTLLKHSGLLSVQLQPPPDPNAPPVDPNAVPVDPALADPALVDPTAARAATIERRHRSGDYVRDGDGQFAHTSGVNLPSTSTDAGISGGRSAHTMGAVADPLKLADRIALGPGERFAGSARVHDRNGDHSVVVARVDGPGGMKIRLGVVAPEDTRVWRAADKGRTVELDQAGAVQFRDVLKSALEQGKKNVSDYRAELRAAEKAGLPEPDVEADIASGVVRAGWGDLNWSLARDEGDDYEAGGVNYGPGGEWSLAIDPAPTGAGEARDSFYADSASTINKLDKALSNLIGTTGDVGTEV